MELMEYKVSVALNRKLSFLDADFAILQMWVLHERSRDGETKHVLDGKT